MKNAPIGILDSGIGGLSIWKEIVDILPQESTLYIADSRNAPYGRFSESEIFQHSKKLVQFLLKNEAKVIVVACNTITVSCLDKLRKTFPHTQFVGTVPAIKTAVNLSRVKKIGILTTERTARSSYQQKLLDQYAKDTRVVTVGTNKLVPLIEVRNREGVGKALDYVLEPFIKEKIDVLVLGCTHYPLIKDLIEEKIGESVLIIDSGKAIAKRVEDEVLSKRKLLDGDNEVGVHRFYTTGSVEDANLTLEQLQISRESGSGEVGEASNVL